MKLGPRQEQWLADLPKYAKTKEFLYVKGKGFCCLGVYADTQVTKPWDEYDRLVLEEPDWKSLGLRSCAGRFSEPILVGEKLFSSLADVNDYGPFRSHSRMATFIREHADKIFTEPK